VTESQGGHSGDPAPAGGRRGDPAPAGGRRIAVVFHEPYVGGATRSVTRIVPQLAERGWEFSFWVPRPSELFDHLAAEGHDVDGAQRPVEYSVRAWRLPPGPWARARSIPAYLRRFREFLRERDPALVHANSVLTIAEALTAHRDGRSVLLHAHEMLPGGPRGALLRRAAWHLDEVVAVSRASAAPFRRRGRDPRIVYEATPVPERAAEIRDAPRPFRVGTVAVVSTRKGSDLYVEAARQVLGRSDKDAFRFEMVGAPNDAVERDWAAGIVEEATRIGIEHHPSADTFERYRSWDAFVLPSRTDPFPIAMLEAMATGIPVIGARRDGLAEQITAGTGVLVEPDDPDALARAILAVAGRGGDERAAMGRAARERVAKWFNLERQAESMHEAYLAALGLPG
jgi:glycosyltransferase involved in cell wall biosynthesis